MKYKVPVLAYLEAATSDDARAKAERLKGLLEMPMVKALTRNHGVEKIEVGYPLEVKP
jgi:hypothetical protein